jgi:hypothetical protein
MEEQTPNIHVVQSVWRRLKKAKFRDLEPKKGCERWRHGHVRNPPRGTGTTETGQPLEFGVSTAVIALTLPQSSGGQGRRKRPHLNRKLFGSPRRKIVFAHRPYLMVTRILAVFLAYHAHDVIAGSELLSIHGFVEVRFGFA